MHRLRRAWENTYDALHRVAERRWRTLSSKLATVSPRIAEKYSSLQEKWQASPKLEGAKSEVQRRFATLRQRPLPMPPKVARAFEETQRGLGSLIRRQPAIAVALADGQKDLRRGLSSFYEALAFETLRALWRRRSTILLFVAAGLLLALVASLLSERRYIAEAIVQLDFGREEPSSRAKGPPTAAMDGAILVESEARFLRSHGLARRVAGRLKLDKDPHYTSRGLLSRLLAVVQRSDADLPGNLNTDLAARSLAKKLAITNDLRSYLITIGITTNSPAESAKLANAFAAEYLNDRTIQRLRELENTARAALADATVVYGQRHPGVIQARANLNAAAARVQAQEKLASEHPDQITSLPGLTLIRAEPIWIPSGPSLVSLFLVCIVGSLLLGIALVLLLERVDNGFRTEFSVPAETGVRCVGMIPSRSDTLSTNRAVEQREALRSLRLAVGLAGQGAGSRVVMIASAVPGEGKSSVVSGLANSLKEDGGRVLIVDATPSSHTGVGASIDDVLGNPEVMRRFLNEQGNQAISELRRASGLNGAFNPFASFASMERNLGQLLANARDLYDVIIIDTPPSMLFADSAFFGRFADISLLVADWKETPRAIVAEAVRRLRENMVRIDGIVLAEVDLDEYPSYSILDPTYYLSQYQNQNTNRS